MTGDNSSIPLTIGVPVWTISPELARTVEIALRSLTTFARSDALEVVIIDNGSTVAYSTATPGTFGAVTTRTIHNGRNRGFTAAVNQILEHARGDYICVCNSDVTVFTPGWDLLLMRTAANDGVAFPAPDPRLAWFPPGFCFLAHRSVFDRIGPWDERFTTFFSDSDYWVRAERAGVPLRARRDVEIHNQRRATHAEAHRRNLLPSNDFEMDRDRFEAKWNGNPLHRGMLTVTQEAA